jgi:hypothetical protein
VGANNFEIEFDRSIFVVVAKLVLTFTHGCEDLKMYGMYSLTLKLHIIFQLGTF